MLKNHCAWDREALLNAAREGYQPWWTKRKPVGINLSTAANFSHWIKDYLTIFHNITDFQQFEITRIEEVTVVRARRHCGVPNAGWSSIGGERTDGYTPVSFCLYLSLSLGLSLSLSLSLSVSLSLSLSRDAADGDLATFCFGIAGYKLVLLRRLKFHIHSNALLITVCFVQNLEGGALTWIKTDQWI